MSDELQAPRLRQRLRQLRALQMQVANEIMLTEARIDAADTRDRKRRSRYTKPPCGTDSGYQWHRYNEPDKWPLPADDPCGCRAAHSAKQRVRHAEKRARKEAA